MEILSLNTLSTSSWCRHFKFVSAFLRLFYTKKLVFLSTDEENLKKN